VFVCLQVVGDKFEAGKLQPIGAGKSQQVGTVSRDSVEWMDNSVTHCWYESQLVGMDDSQRVGVLK
jgi:hypothetical protein